MAAEHLGAEPIGSISKYVDASAGHFGADVHAGVATDD